MTTTTHRHLIPVSTGGKRVHLPVRNYLPYNARIKQYGAAVICDDGYERIVVSDEQCGIYSPHAGCWPDAAVDVDRGCRLCRHATDTDNA